MAPKPANDRLTIRRILDNDDAFFDGKAYEYFSRLLEAIDPNSRFALRICQSAEQNLHLTHVAPGVKFPQKKTKQEAYYNVKNRNQKVVPEDWEALKTYFKAEGEKATGGEPDGFHKNLMKLADYLGVDETGKEVLTLLDVLRRNQFKSEFVAGILGKNQNIPAGVALMLGRENEYRKIAELLSPNGPLVENGLIYIEPDMEEALLPVIDEELIYDLSEGDMDEEAILRKLLGQPQKTELDIGDFDYLGEELQYVERLIDNALKRGETGINILFYGEAGGGKTELSRALAKHFGVQLFGIGEDGNLHGDGSSFKKRMMEMRRAQALLKHSRRSLLLFDEMEDLLNKGTDSSKKADTESKIGLNRLLETNPVITIWTANDPEKFHPAVRRRFTYSIHLGRQPTLVRKKAWERHLALQSFPLPERDVLELARKYEAPPSMIGKAIKSAAMMGGDRKEIEKSIEADARITYAVDGQGSEIVVDGHIPADYTLGLLNAGPGFEEQVDVLVSRTEKAEPYALFVRAKPGSGVSTLAQYIGERGRKTVTELSMKDLSRPTPFSSPEGNIRAAFQQAANDNSVLVIRDLEYLVPAPESPDRQWEDNSLVDAFKSALVGHKKPFIAVTQSDAQIPESVTGYFSHTLNLDYLTPIQAKEAYKLFFSREAPEELAQGSGLVPAHFAAVRRLVNMAGSEVSDERIVALLWRERDLRRGTGSDMGFSVSPAPR